MDFGIAGCPRLWLAALTETVDLVWAEAVDFELAGGRMQCMIGVRAYKASVCRSEYVPVKAN